jgi:hypothetical protein
VFSGTTEITVESSPTSRPTPVTRSPITDRPTTQKPVTLTPSTSKPTTDGPSSSPSSARFPVGIRYEISFRNGDTKSGIEDLVAAFNLLAPQVVAETFPTVRHRRRLTVTIELPTRVIEVVNTSKFFSPV